MTDTKAADFQAALTDLENDIKRRLSWFETEYGVYIEQVECDRRPNVGVFSVSVFTTSPE